MEDGQYLVFYCIVDSIMNKMIGSIAIRPPEHPNGQLGEWINEKF